MSKLWDFSSRNLIRSSFQIYEMAGKPSKTVQKKHSKRPQIYRKQKNQRNYLQQLKSQQQQKELEEWERELEEMERELELGGPHGGRTCWERERDITEANIAYGRLELRFYFALYVWRAVLIGSFVAFLVWIIVKFGFF